MANLCEAKFLRQCDASLINRKDAIDNRVEAESSCFLNKVTAQDRSNAVSTRFSMHVGRKHSSSLEASLRIVLG